MGNRAVITFNTDENAPSIYLHWNGGRASVEAFLQAAKDLGVRQGDEAYQLARLAQIIGNYMGGTLSLGIVRYGFNDKNNGDNGVYVVGPNFKIIERIFPPSQEHVDEDYTQQIYNDIITKQAAIFADN